MASKKKTYAADDREYVEASMGSSKKKPCKVGQVLALLSVQERSNLLAAFGNPMVTQTGIVNVITKKLPNIELSPAALTSHKRGTCTCAIQT